ncbi:alkyl hydroperoxide reductase subunit D [Planctomicrobium piriforme]|uniref:Alkyl hydroperoxide reductase subunit D n=2 Tax=Planctomicrobium piriforme TaxID=1576369 RepID=A0A1I3RPT5_9PLAN|nr:alkyl hydroperoxide reductase subunit D [Planctomicrobium piriforme]
MPLLEPVLPSNASEKVTQQYARIREMLGTEEIPEPFLVYGNVEAFLRDFYMNYKKFVYTDGHLDAKSKAAIALAIAAHGKCKPWLELMSARCVSLGYSTEQVAEILAVAATNYMYNTFFKFRDLSGSSLFEGMGVGLRAHTFTGTSLGDKLVELINVVISDINACKPCTSGHVEKAKEMKITSEQLLEAIQCGATMYAGVQFLNSAT